MLSEELRHIVEVMDISDVFDKGKGGEYKTTILQAADLLDVYYIQCKAVTGAERLGQAKVYVRHALLEDV